MTRKLPPEELEGLKERGWRQIAAIDAAFERGEIGEDGWHHAMADLVVPAYLAGDNPRHSPATRVTPCGGRARRLLLDAVDADGTFLDVGCANGHLMECVQRWAGEEGNGGRAVRPRDLARAGGPRLSASRNGGSEFSRQRARLVSAVASTSCGRTWTTHRRSDDRPPPPARRCRRARWPTHRRRLQRGQAHAALEAAVSSWGLTIAGRTNAPIRTSSLFGAPSGSTLRRGRKEQPPAKLEAWLGATFTCGCRAVGPAAALSSGRRETWLPSRRATLATLVTMLAGAALYVGARETSVFAIDRIEVQGVSPGVAARVRAALEPLAGSSLIAFDATDGDKRLASVPTVAAASYDRDFPHEGDGHSGGADRTATSRP